MKTSALKKHILSGGLDAIICILYKIPPQELFWLGVLIHINAITEFERL